MSALEPSFWNRYEPPATHVAALVQRPEYRITADALFTAYFRDSTNARRSALEAIGEKEE